MEHWTNIMNSFQNGASSYIFMALVALVFADLALGVGRSISQHKFNSTIALSGVTKHALILIVPLMLYPFADVLGYTSIGDTILSFLVLSQAGSVLENWISLGLPFRPEWRKFFDDKKIEQKERTGSVHTDDPVPDETDKKL